MQVADVCIFKATRRALHPPSVLFTPTFNDANAFEPARLRLLPSQLEEVLQICGEPGSSVNIRGISKALQDDFYGYYLLALLHFPPPPAPASAVWRGCLKVSKVVSRQPVSGGESSRLNSSLSRVLPASRGECLPPTRAGGRAAEVKMFADDLLLFASIIGGRKQNQTQGQ